MELITDTEDSPDDIENDWDFIESIDAVKNQTGNARQATPTPFRRQPFFEMVLKNKMMCSLYNLYSRFPTEPPSFRDDTIWLLGHKYELSEEEKNIGKNTKTGQYQHASTFIRDVHEQFIWFTYRQDFPVIQEYNSTSDIGWGCMLRTGQMMLAKVLLTLIFSTEWRLTIDQKQQPYTLYRQLLRWFSDIHKKTSPYSIHNLITNNTTIYGHSPGQRDSGGEWFSPSKIAHILEHIISSEHPSGMVMYVPMDGIIYVDQILRICTEVPKNISQIVPQETPPIYINPTAKKPRKNSKSSKKEKMPSISSSILASFVPINNESYNFFKTQEEVECPLDTLPPSGLSRKNSNNTKPTENRNNISDIPQPPEKPSKLNIYPHLEEEPCDDVNEKSSLLYSSTQMKPVKQNSSESSIKKDGEKPEKPEKLNSVTEERWNPLFVIIPSRIGVEKMNRAYVPHIKYILSSKYSVGIIGGKPRASLYFIGFQGNNIIYLDPHIVQDTIREDQDVDNDALETYHCKIPLKMPITSIDPSLAIGFFFKTQQDFFEFMAWHGQFETSGNASIFSLAQKTPSYVNKKTNSESSSQALSGSF